MMVFLLSSFALTSCGDDDDKDGPSGSAKQIVGTWSCDNHYYGGTDYFTFNSDGTYSWDCPGSWHTAHSGHYTYNETSGLLIVVKNNGSSWTYLAQFVNKTTFILTDEDGDSYTYTKE